MTRRIALSVLCIPSPVSATLPPLIWRPLLLPRTFLHGYTTLPINHAPVPFCLFSTQQPSYTSPLAYFKIPVARRTRKGKKPHHSDIPAQLNTVPTTAREEVLGRGGNEAKPREQRACKSLTLIYMKPNSTLSMHLVVHPLPFVGVTVDVSETSCRAPSHYDPAESQPGQFPDPNRCDSSLAKSLAWICCPTAYASTGFFFQVHMHSIDTTGTAIGATEPQNPSWLA